ncbi:type I restriction modification DNA specificity domain protein [Candidatus Colimorpha enterica]|uniref:Type I restriction modification DNA specificity domain protein n=1 Tax=Candidatus Colimorpha enterica TaxID=3083063 RepID=R6TBU6_9BACT|nr:type I restriction modification DNA specificity domain protein [Candidatus Colimorpha enterica]
MKSIYKSIGELVERIDQRNTDGTVTNLIGVSIDKKFINSVANVIGTDLTKYKVIEKYDFAVSLMQVSRDEKIPVACQKEYDKAIMSPAYPIFRVKDTSVVLPEYLEMWFMRPEFDREASFIAVGGVRGSMPWEEFANMKLPVPSIEEQREIVNSYMTLTDRIALKKQINDNLEATARTIYKSYFVDFEPFDLVQPESWQEVTIDDIAKEVVCGKTPPTADAENYGGSVPFITIPDMHGSVYTTSTERFLSDKGVATQANKTLPENSICVSCIASVGLVCLTAEPSQTNQQINSIVCKKKISPFYVYIKMTTLTEYLKQLGAGGSTTLNVNKTLFGQIPILLPDETVMNEFHRKVEPLFSTIRENQYEIQHLESLKSLLLTQISSR